jgi:hypothetical protein
VRVLVAKPLSFVEWLAEVSAALLSHHTLTRPVGHPLPLAGAGIASRSRALKKILRKPLQHTTGFVH